MLGEISTTGSLLGRLIKFSLYFLVVIVFMFQIHLIAFSVLEIFGISHEFSLQEPGVFGKVYNGFLKINNKIVAKSGKVGALGTIFFIISTYYIAYYFTKNKDFPQVIIKVIINSILILFGYGFVINLVGQFNKSDIVAYILVLVPIVFAFILFYKKRLSKPGEENKEKVRINKQEKENQESLVFETNQGDILLENPYRGIYIQGGAGSGKSGSLFQPIIKQIGEKNYSGILYDYKSPDLTSKI